MAGAYSLDLRKRVIASIETGASCPRGSVSLCGEHRRGKAPPQGGPGGRQVRGKTRPVDRSAGQTAPGASRRQSSRRVHPCEGQAARKLAVIL
jgi:hypothetical protein